jgi:hypothetical protein
MMKMLKTEQIFRFLHTATIAVALFLVNRPIGEQSQDNFQQILINISQDSIAYLMK